jgi:hypothetical protein
LPAFQSTRRELLAQWDEATAEDLRQLQRAANRVSKRLKDRVRVSVKRSASLGDLESITRGHCSGNISQPLERLRTTEDLSLTERRL